MNIADKGKSKGSRLRIAIISLLTLAALGYLLILGLQVFVFIRMHALTRLADKAYTEKNFKRAARYAVAVIAYEDLRLIKLNNDSDRAEATLIRVLTLSLASSEPVLTKPLPKYITPYDYQPQTLWMSRDGKRLAVMASDENDEIQASLWDVEKAQMIGSPFTHMLHGVSDDNAIYVVLNSDRTVDLIDARNHTPLFQGIVWPDRAISPFQLSSDHRFLAITRHRLGLYLLDLKGKKEWELFNFPNEGISFTTDSQSLRIKDPDNIIEPIILDLKTFKTHRKFERFFEWYNDPLIFNKRVSVSTYSKGIRFSSIATGQTLHQIRIPENVSVSEVAANDHIVTAVDFDHVLRTYSIPPVVGLKSKALVEHACLITLAGATSRFTNDELKTAPLLDPVRDRDVCHRQ